MNRIDTRSLKLIILTFLDYYLPGFKGGGPMRTVSNMVDQLHQDLSFEIVTRDRDLGGSQSYPGIVHGRWMDVNGAKVYYVSESGLPFAACRRLIMERKPDVLYLNSIFSLPFAIKPLVLRLLHLIRHYPVVLAPRGELSPGALAINSTKKRTYLTIARAIGLFRGVVWQASTELEARDIRREFGGGATIVVAQDLPAVHAEGLDQVRSQKIAGVLKVVFLSRISRKKNLDGALRILGQVNGQVQFDIYGPVEDPAYWAECQEIVQGLPDKIHVKYCGSVPHERVVKVLSEYELFFFPTRGENFGHVVLEAFMAGCLVLISDQTPWRNLRKHQIGWDINLEEPKRFVEKIEECIAMDAATHKKRSEQAKTFAYEFSKGISAIAQNRLLFAVASEGAH